MNRLTLTVEEIGALRKFAEGLRSPRYKQITGTLRAGNVSPEIAGGKEILQCCFWGVACDVLDPDGWGARGRMNGWKFGYQNDALQMVCNTSSLDCIAEGAITESFIGLEDSDVPAMIHFARRPYKHIKDALVNDDEFMWSQPDLIRDALKNTYSGSVEDMFIGMNDNCVCSFEEFAVILDKLVENMSPA